jgi:hypothetical protein
MRTFASILGLGCLLALAGGVASAADVARLEWGVFVVEADSSNGTQEWKSLSSDDGHSMSLTFESLEAKADGATREASAGFSGHFDISQPGFDVLPYCRVELRGHVIKSKGSVARLVLKLGAEEKTMEWPAGVEHSEAYTRTVDISVSDEGRLPNPFAVSAQAYVRKDGQSDAAYVSLESIKIIAENPKVAVK